MTLLTLAEAKAALGKTTTADDAQIQQFVDAAKPVIEDIVGPVDEANKTATFNGGRCALCLPTPAASVVTVTVDGDAWTTDQWTANLTAGIVYAGSSQSPAVFPSGRQNVVIEYTVGAATVAANVKLAAIELVRFWWQIGRQGNRPGYGDAPQADEYTPSGFAVPRRVIELCGPNPRLPGFA